MTAIATKRSNSNEALIGFEPLIEIIETTLYSAYLSDTIPQSSILIGPSGGGKSKGIIQYKDTNGCHLTSDVTSSGLLELLGNDHAGKINFLVIPDFNVVLSHKASTLQLTIANLLSATSEGTVRYDDGRQKKEAKHTPVGIVTAMTRELYEQVAKKWSVLGFQRRFLPLYFEYGLETRLKIQSSIARGTTTFLQLAARSIVAPEKLREIKANGVANEIQVLSDELATNMGWVPIRSSSTSKRGGKFKPKSWNMGKQLEFSPHLTLRTLARSHALRRGAEEVGQDDIDFLLRVLRFTRYDRPGVL